MTGMARIFSRNPLARLPKPHASEARYRVGCRCDACRAAHADRVARGRWRRRQRLGIAERHDWGGRATCYNSGCSHPECRAAHAERGRLYRERKRVAAPWEALRGAAR